jgi:hypothetical protein
MSELFSDMSTKELKDLALGLHTAIYDIESYSCSDMHNYVGAVEELENRGFEVTEEKKLVISKRK